AAIFLGPGDPDPTGGVHLLLPGDALFQYLAVGRDALVGSVVDADLGRQVGFEPMTKFAAEGSVLGTVGEIHTLASRYLPKMSSGKKALTIMFGTSTSSLIFKSTATLQMA